MLKPKPQTINAVSFAAALIASVIDFAKAQPEWKSQSETEWTKEMRAYLTTRTK